MGVCFQSPTAGGTEVYGNGNGRHPSPVMLTDLDPPSPDPFHGSSRVRGKVVGFP